MPGNHLPHREQPRCHRDFVTVSVSFGVSTKISEEQNIADLIEEAEFEMYNQKGLMKKPAKP